MKTGKRLKAKVSHLVHVTVEERDLLLDLVEPAGGFDVFFQRARITGRLVELELTAAELTDFLDLVEQTGTGAQNGGAGERLCEVYERIHCGLKGRVDPGAHLVRPAASSVGFTGRQGQYLAFIHTYLQLHGRPPAEAELQRYFRVSPPAVHEMLKTLQRRQYISRQAGQARSIRLLLPAEQIPALLNHE